MRTRLNDEALKIMFEFYEGYTKSIKLVPTQSLPAV